MTLRQTLGSALVALAVPAAGQTVTRVDGVPAGLRPLPATVSGRVQEEADGTLLRQWPGTYFETGFRGTAALFRVGAGRVSLRVSVDGGPAVKLVQPEPGLYRIGGLGTGRHRLRVDVASESQAGPTGFGGFLAESNVRPAPIARRRRAIEFIGDSHTVGYGNTSATRACSPDEIWASTDTTRGLPALMAGRYGADYRVHAISGRGVVRNYNGFAADTLPQAYPFVLFDKARPARDPAWRPQVIAIALGTNDFSTPLHAGERWATRDRLHAEYEAEYVAFVGRLRAAHPRAYILLWASDMAEGEIAAEVGKVADRLRASGDTRTGFVQVRGLAFAGCNAHPDLADDRRIADALVGHLDAQPDAWRDAAPLNRSGSPR